MKKIITLGLCLATLALSIVSCGPAKKTTDCEACGKQKVECTEFEMDGEKAWLCESCYKLAEVAKDAMGK